MREPLPAEVVARTQVHLSDAVLAFVAGLAGTRSFTAALPGALIGVMVAIALMPPLVSAALLVGAGAGSLAWGAALLFMANITALNLAGLITFYVQGVRPFGWWEQERARRATLRSIALWAALLLALLLVVLGWQRGGGLN